MAGIDQALQALRAAVGVLGSEGADPVVPPVPAPGKLGHGHELDRGNSQLAEPFEVGDDGVEGPFGGVDAHMELVEDVLFKGEPRPAPVLPGKGRVHHLGGPVDPLGLEPRGGVGTLFPALQPVEVKGARLHPFGPPPVVAPFPPPEGNQALLRPCQADLN